MTLTIKLDGNWSSFQLANSAPPLSVTDSAIAPSARMLLPVLSWQGHLCDKKGSRHASQLRSCLKSLCLCAVECYACVLCPCAVYFCLPLLCCGLHLRPSLLCHLASWFPLRFWRRPPPASPLDFCWDLKAPQKLKKSH